MKHTFRFKVKELSGAMTYRTDRSSAQLKKDLPRTIAARLRNIGFTINDSSVEIISVEADDEELTKKGKK